MKVDVSATYKNKTYKTSTSFTSVNLAIYEVTVEKCTVQDSSIFVGHFNTLENAQRAGLRTRTSIDDEALIVAMSPNVEGKFVADRMWELIEFEWVEQPIYINGALQ